MTEKNINNEEVELSKEWLKKFTQPRRTINKEFSAYQLKHCVENSIGKNHGAYISLESFTKAAIDLGYTVNKNGNLNAIYKAAKKCPEDSAINKTY